VIRTPEDEAAYSRLLRNLLDDHTHVVTQLAAGFKECRKHIQVKSSFFKKVS
jgi:[3-methyl-2-oxobutanoate dehydrogenase (acetyl-transferring)] kinase